MRLSLIRLMGLHLLTAGMIGPGLGGGDVIGKSSTGLSTAEFAEFCTQVEAFACTDLGVTFYDLEPRA